MTRPTTHQDDEPEVIFTDDPDGDLDDDGDLAFADDDYRDDLDGDRMLSDLWGRYSGRSTWVPMNYGSQASRASSEEIRQVLSALRMAQGLVSTFATSGDRYHVGFNANIQTAGTDLKGKKVIISPAVLGDSTLTVDEANRVLTALACHEASHVKYGKRFLQAADAKFPGNALAHSVSNLLADVHDERAFARDYPGFDHIFAAALDYVGKATIPAGTRAVDAPNASIGIGALRYPDFIDWTGAEDELRWWNDWADQYSHSEKVADHVKAVQVALDHLAEPKPPTPPRPTGPGGDQPGGGSGGQGEQGQDKDEDGEPGQGQGEPTDEQGQPSDRNGQGGGRSFFPELEPELTEAIEDVAKDHGSTMKATVAQAIANQADTWQPGPAGGGLIYLNHKRVRAGSVPLQRQGIDAAAASIRAAFARSRTGHTAVDRPLKRGSVDNRSLARVAWGDSRVCHKRTAPSIGKYRVWVLGDCSGSMSGAPGRQQAEVALALAQASRFVPSVNLSVYGWTTAPTSAQAVFEATRFWTTGQPLAGRFEKFAAYPRGGTPDVPVFAWARTAILKELEPGETPVIVFTSDGAGYGVNQMAAEVAKARKAGIVVTGVGLDAYVNDAMDAAFGQGNITWQGTVARTAGPLGRLFGRLVAPR